ncbi:MAG: threonine--tRNA ligase [Candidatus Zixiibacteriota bacterium]
MALELKFPDGTIKSFPDGTTGYDVAHSISPRLAQEALAVTVDDEIYDLARPLPKGGEFKVHTFDTPQGKWVFWHSSAHVMAEAVQDLFPGTKLAIGPPIDEGFYYDFDAEKPFTDEDLARIEKRMAEIVAGSYKFEREDVSRDEAIRRAQAGNEPFKIELIGGLQDGTISYYKHDHFIDLCRGPHLPSTDKIKAFKLLSVAGAYWRGDEKNKMLQRIYGVSYPKKAMLDDYIKRLEEAKKRDHRKLGKELGLFTIAEETGGGLPLWLPKGALMRHLIENFWKETHLANGYDLVISPHIARLHLWETSGHTGFYRENMYSPMDVDNEKYQIKPMNCPFHIMMYKQNLHSYRELPLRWAELGTVYRYERGGVLHGLFRVRGFTQDDAHIFCTPEQLEAEVLGVLDLTVQILGAFGFHDYHIYLSTRPEKAIGEPSLWETAEGSLRKALEKRNMKYDVDAGGGAFYGPKIDIKIRDAMQREWQCTTVQFDFNLPQRFDLTYIDSDGQAKQPYMVHRAILGSLERFFGVLIEHFGGFFPMWIAPVQAKVIPITDKQMDFAMAIHRKLLAAGIRSEFDDRSEKIGYKIREAETAKIPYMLVVGAKEVESGHVALRQHGQGDIGVFTLEAIIERFKSEISSRELPRQPVE